MCDKAGEALAKSLIEKEGSNRKRELSSVSSCSEIEMSMTEKHKKERQKKKKGKFGDDDPISLATIAEEISSINRKMENVLTKDDGNLRQMVEDIVRLSVKSVEKQIEALENRIFEKQLENDALNTSVKQLSDQLDDAKHENMRLKNEITKQHEDTQEKFNNLEQYSRRNNVIIEGLPDNEGENTHETVKKVIARLNDNIPGLDLAVEDIDTTHRMGQYKKERARAIIVKLQSRLRKQDIMKGRKKLHKEKKVYISDDLTKLNRDVLTSVRVKQRDIIKAAWSFEGSIYYKDVNELTHKVAYKNYNYWLNLPWPEKQGSK